jgi:NAD(P)H dehydrogenase (quinone)
MPRYGHRACSRPPRDPHDGVVDLVLRVRWIQLACGGRKRHGFRGTQDAEGFQAAFNQVDRSAYFLQKPLPSEILREQERVDRADALVLVYPVYWWSFPGQLKGWIDRVFSNGLAYDEAPDGTLGKRLGRLAVHLIGIGGADGGTYARHGYDRAMRTQIDHGIFDFCGARVVTSEFLLDVNGQVAASHVATARALGGKAFARAASSVEAGMLS